MAEPDVENELLDYDEQDEEPEQVTEAAGDAPAKKDVKGTYVSIHSSGFRDFLLKPELLRAIVDCGFEHPSEGKDNKDGPICVSMEFIWPNYQYAFAEVQYLTYHNYYGSF